MKNKKILIMAVAVILVVLIAVLVIVNGGSNKAKNKGDAEAAVAERIADGDFEIAQDLGGISVVSIDTIAGVFVEDGSDDVLNEILTITIKNEADITLQYAKIIMTIGDEEYDFEISTLPAGRSVRAMEMNKKTLESAKGEISISQDNIAWFAEEPSMCEDKLNIIQQTGGIVVENISGETINAPIYVYYKNYADDIYVGGITYRSGTEQSLEPGKSVALSAEHFDPEASQLMFVTYVP